MRMSSTTLGSPPRPYVVSRLPLPPSLYLIFLLKGLRKRLSDGMVLTHTSRSPVICMPIYCTHNTSQMYRLGGIPPIPPSVFASPQEGRVLVPYVSHLCARLLHLGKEADSAAKIQNW